MRSYMTVLLHKGAPTLAPRRLARTPPEACSPLLIPSYPHLAPSPGIHRMFDGSTIRQFIVAIARRCVLRNDLFHRHPVPLFDIEREDERVPMGEPILPTLYLGIPSPITINTGT